MLNNKGYYSSSTVLIVILISLMMMGLFTNPIVNSRVRVTSSRQLQEYSISMRNGYERFYGVLYNNPSQTADVQYSDLEQTFKITEVSSEYNTIKKTGTSIRFGVYNTTDINIGVDMQGSEDDPSSFLFTMRGPLSEFVEPSVKFTNITSTYNHNVNIDKKDVYNSIKGVTNYGLNEISLSGSGLGLVTVTYDQLVERVITIDNGKDAIRTMKIVINYDINDVPVINIFEIM